MVDPGGARDTYQENHIGYLTGGQDKATGRK